MGSRPYQTCGVDIRDYHGRCRSGESAGEQEPVILAAHSIARTPRSIVLQ